MQERCVRAGMDSPRVGRCSYWLAFSRLVARGNGKHDIPRPAANTPTYYMRNIDAICISRDEDS
jgi:hypothetical protein